MNFLDDYAKAERAHIFMKGCEIVVGIKDVDTMNEFNDLYGESELSVDLVTDVRDWVERKNLDCVVWFGGFAALTETRLAVRYYPFRMELDFTEKREKIWQLVSYFETNNAKCGNTLLNLKNWAQARKVPCKVSFFGWRGLTLRFQLWLRSQNGQWPVKPVKRLF